MFFVIFSQFSMELGVYMSKFHKFYDLQVLEGVECTMKFWVKTTLFHMKMRFGDLVSQFFVVGCVRSVPPLPAIYT